MAPLLRLSRRWPALHALPLLLVLGTRAQLASGESVAGPPPLEVRTGGVTHVAVGGRVALSLLDHGGGGWRTRVDGVRFQVRPADVAVLEGPATLVALRPGRALVTGTLPGVGTSLETALEVLPQLTGGVLPRLDGLKGTETWRLDWWFREPGDPPGLLLAWEGSGHALRLSAAPLPRTPPPWSFDVPSEWAGYARVDRTSTAPRPAPRSARLDVTSWSAGVAEGSASIVTAEGATVRFSFTAALPLPLAAEVAAQLVTTTSGSVQADGRPAAFVRCRPRGSPPRGRLLALPPATGLDDGARRAAESLAGEGYDVVLLDLYDGAMAPDPTVLAEGHVPRDAGARQARERVAAALESGRALAAVLAASRSAFGREDRAARPPVLIGWGEAGPTVVAALAQPVAWLGAVLIDPMPAPAWGPLTGLSVPIAFVLGLKGSTGSGALAAEAARAPAEGPRREAWAYPEQPPGFADPRWPLRYGPVTTQDAHARLLGFLADLAR